MAPVKNRFSMPFRLTKLYRSLKKILSGRVEIRINIPGHSAAVMDDFKEKNRCRRQTGAYLARGFYSGLPLSAAG